MLLDITINLDRDPWPEIKDTLDINGLGNVVRIGRLPQGMNSGKSAVVVVIRMPDGREFVAETSMALFQNAARVLLTADEENT